MVEPEVRAEWAAAPGWVLGQAAGALGIGLLGAGSDGAGRVLAVLAAVLLAGGALRDGLLRPTLAADAAGVRVRTGLSSHQWRWAELTSVRAVASTRRLVTARSVELEFGDVLVLLATRRLGAQAEAVVDRLQALSRP
ncbi:MAG: hypothetical protein NVSMB13_12960 [Mycobacteriales bacterium]